jgi:hypothetical protein
MRPHPVRAPGSEKGSSPTDIAVRASSANPVRRFLALTSVMSLRPPFLLACLLVVASCRSPSPAPTTGNDEESAKAAQAALAPFRASLKGALQKAMADSPEAAIDACATQAPALASAHASPGVTMGRSAMKLRNEANAPRPWLVPVMDRLARAPSGTDAHELVALGGGRHGYAEAIWTAPMCLTCHGDAIAPSLAAKLDARYPHDAARGFRAGELRGVFWVELDAPARSR